MGHACSLPMVSYHNYDDCDSHPVMRRCRRHMIIQQLPQRLPQHHVKSDFTSNCGCLLICVWDFQQAAAATVAGFGHGLRPEGINILNPTFYVRICIPSAGTSRKSMCKHHGAQSLSRTTSFQPVFQNLWCVPRPFLRRACTWSVQVASIEQ